jgi:CMP-N,N'-diacetyllegionaminic acid synthase
MSKIKMAKIIGVIHARGGSKRIPLKNIKPLNKIPLIGYMIKAALRAKMLDRVIVSSDHEEIIRIAKDFGAEAPFKRPKEISSDCPSEFVTQHAVSFVEKQQKEAIDIVVSMQPTTPFCDGNDIDACIEMLVKNKKWDSVFSGNIVMERPEWMFKIDKKSNGKLLIGEILKGETGVVQTLPELIVPNGGIYATRRDILFEKNVIIAPDTGIHVMPLEKSIDIDVPLDFEFAEFMAMRSN